MYVTTLHYYININYLQYYIKVLYFILLSEYMIIKHKYY